MDLNPVSRLFPVFDKLDDRSILTILYNISEFRNKIMTSVKIANVTVTVTTWPN